jgi:Mat/Ecp fimbriae outer membrane usher protein
MLDLAGGMRYSGDGPTGGANADDTGGFGHARVIWEDTDVLLDDKLRLAAGVFRETNLGGLETQANYNALSLGSISSTYVRTRDDDGEWLNNYGGNFSFGLIGNTEGIDLSGSRIDRSGVMIALTGNSGDALFDVVVGGQRFGTIQSGEVRAIALGPYETYKINLVPVGGGFVTLLGEPQEVTLYPGNVVSLEFKAASFVPAFGRIVREDGGSIGIARILGTLDSAVTDDLGFFQTELSEPGTLVIQPLQGPDCEVTVESLGDNQVFAKLGTLVCVPVPESQ